jgi:hypothetical protein
VSVFVHLPGQIPAKAFTRNGLIVGIAVEKQGRQASFLRIGIGQKAKKIIHD